MAIACRHQASSDLRHTDLCWMLSVMIFVLWMSHLQDCTQRAWRRKVKDLEYGVIANGHGPVLRHNLEELVGRYKSWSESVGKAAASVAVLYSSDYGFSDR